MCWFIVWSERYTSVAFVGRKVKSVTDSKNKEAERERVRLKRRFGRAAKRERLISVRYVSLSFSDIASSHYNTASRSYSR